MAGYLHTFVHQLVWFLSIALVPLLFATFLVAALLRWAIFYSAHRAYRFMHDFETRVHDYVNHSPRRDSDFPQLANQLMQVVFDQHFPIPVRSRQRLKRLWYRFFSIEKGLLRMMNDTGHYTDYLERLNSAPEFTGIAKLVMLSNPIFNRVFPISPMGVINQLINALPGILLTGGVLGMVLRMAGHEVIELGEITPLIVPVLVGMTLSIGCTILNAFMNSEGLLLNLINKFSCSIEYLFQHTRSSEIGMDLSVQPLIDDTESSGPHPLPPPPAPPGRRPNQENVLGLDFGDMHRTEPTMGDDLKVDFLPPDEGHLDPSGSLAPLPDADPLEPPEIKAKRERVQWLDQRMMKATNDRESGMISEQMWKDKTNQWTAEREKLLEEIKSVTSKKSDGSAA